MVNQLEEDHPDFNLEMLTLRGLNKHLAEKRKVPLFDGLIIGAEVVLKPPRHDQRILPGIAEANLGLTHL